MLVKVLDMLCKELEPRDIPLIGFAAITVFLFMGLGSDPRKLESSLIWEPVPEFTLQDLFDENRRYDRSVFSGEPLLLNVWATWCPTCYAEHQYLNELSRAGIRIVGMNYKDERDKAILWLQRLDDPYRINLFDPDGMLGLDLGVYGAPETFLIDGNGIIRYRHVGDVNPRVWKQTLEPLYLSMEQGGEG